MRNSDRIADTRSFNFLNARDYKTHFTGTQLIAWCSFGREHADCVGLKGSPGRHDLYLLAFLDAPFNHSHKCDNTDIGIEPGIDDQGFGRVVR